MDAAWSDSAKSIELKLDELKLDSALFINQASSLFDQTSKKVVEDQTLTNLRERSATAVDAAQEQFLALGDMFGDKAWGWWSEPSNKPSK